MLFSSVLAATVALLGPSLIDASPNPVPAKYVATFDIGEPDCYDSLYGFKKVFNQQFQAPSACAGHCVPLGKPVMAINDTDCWCSDNLPPKKNKVDLSKCSEKCPGYGDFKCGSDDGKYFSTWTDGLTKDGTAKNADAAEADAAASKASEAAASKATTPSVVTNFVGGQTVIVTKSPEAKENDSSPGPNKVGIAVGVVVGVIAIAALIGGMWFFLRARNRRELEDAHRRQAAINAFVKSPNDAPAFDTRLEPAIMRRMSAGSIADNQDYSRRILKVTNA
ncbi:hypothetical protein V495_06664 [Pseudogymnoascus sp. VKM F-4514 (FW-929)]|nr:hypothetical protein V495_06664 [Pseudogymnoascus sp. VKM F-4514 (FW-929)]KFY52297.1 hypothetical protein V497_08564 [Pseudogymnoascus sp. VKM F-4516 (FW-969)]